MFLIFTIHGPHMMHVYIMIMQNDLQYIRLCEGLLITLQLSFLFFFKWTCNIFYVVPQRKDAWAVEEPQHSTELQHGGHDDPHSGAVRSPAGAEQGDSQVRDLVGRHD